MKTEMPELSDDYIDDEDRAHPAWPAFILHSDLCWCSALEVLEAWEWFRSGWDAK